MTTLNVKQMEEAKDLIAMYEMFLGDKDIDVYIEKDIKSYGKQRDIFNSSLKDIFIGYQNCYILRTYEYNSKKGEFDIPKEDSKAIIGAIEKALISYELVIKKLGMDNVAQNTAK